MKKIFLLIWILVYSSNSFAEWTPIVTNAFNNNVYLDIESIKRMDKYTYVWTLEDFKNKKDEFGDLSKSIIYEIDCRKNLIQVIQIITHPKPMGLGFGKEYKFDDNWINPPPLSTFGVVKTLVCDYANKNL
tara:strand:- start:107 stop:499 length:393 start_codon:yes stop_codon:yes gene_type:complete